MLSNFRLQVHHFISRIYQRLPSISPMGVFRVTPKIIPKVNLWQIIVMAHQFHFISAVYRHDPHIYVDNGSVCNGKPGRMTDRTAELFI